MESVPDLRVRMDKAHWNVIGDWQYGWRTYGDYGEKQKPELQILHKKSHWVGEAHMDKGKCRCGEPIPGVILMHRLLVKSGYQ